MEILPNRYALHINVDETTENVFNICIKVLHIRVLPLGITLQHTSFKELVFNTLLLQQNKLEFDIAGASTNCSNNFPKCLFIKDKILHYLSSAKNFCYCHAQKKKL